MINFVMLDVPDFVLIQADETDGAQRLDDEPIFLNPLFADIFHELGIQMDHAMESDTVQFTRAARLQMAPILRRYGFERLPRTVGELCGLFDYCDRLDVLTGAGMFAPEALARWQQLTSELRAQRTAPPHQPAVELYREGNAAGLLAWHDEQDALTEIGRCYRYVPGR